MDDFQEKVKEKIKLYSNEKYLDGYIQDEFLLGDGTAEIFLNIRRKEELFDMWTIGKQEDLEKDIYDFIEEKTAMLGNRIPIKLHIMGYHFTAAEQSSIKHILKEHFAIELYKIQKEYEKYHKKIFSLIGLGIFSLVLYAFLCHIPNSQFFQTVFTFLFSFSLWEAMDAIIYTFSEIKYKREAVTQNLLMTVEFDSHEDVV